MKQILPWLLSVSMLVPAAPLAVLAQEDIHLAKTFSVPSDVIAQGHWGISWYLGRDGVLHIAAGQFDPVPANLENQLWFNERHEVRSVVVDCT